MSHDMLIKKGIVGAKLSLFVFMKIDFYFWLFVDAMFIK